jgi:uncharacterized protein (DUF2267 family)
MTTSIPAFEETIQLTNQWLNELMRAVDWKDKQRTYRLLRATLHALRDYLPAHEAVHFGAQLPMLIRGIYYEGWHIKDHPAHERSKQEFIDHVEASFARDPNSDPEELIREVLRLLARRISAGEVRIVKHVLPPQVRALWPAEEDVEGRAH